MKNKVLLFIISFVLLAAIQNVYSQLAYSPRIDSIINLSTEQTMSKLNRELSGDTSTIIGGLLYTITTRYYSSASNTQAGQYIFEKFQGYGLYTRYMIFRPSTNGRNVIGVKAGTKYPTRMYIICGHYDDVPSSGLAPGADDNASGTCAVIEAARLIAPLSLDYTVIFIAFDEEEIGLYGSRAYADTAFYNNHDTILGVINLDMIAWDGNNDNYTDIHTNTNSVPFADMVISAYNTYVPSLVPSKIFSISGGSDHQSFWNRGYKAILHIESTSDFNPYYHTVNDNFSHVNVPYFTKMTKAAISALLSFAWDYRIEFSHTPITSSNYTGIRTAAVVIKSPHPLVKSGANIPRLYYKVNNGSFNPLGPFYIVQDTFYYHIPGQPYGSTIRYYFAAQDSLARFVGTYPAGGKGISPPGTIPPSSFFNYQVVNVTTTNACSNTLPKPILDNQNTYDTIFIAPYGNVIDANVNLTIYHTYDGDISIFLKGPNNTEIDLSSRNGGSGNNYINTTFDDEAATPITSGTPPFTGSFRPEQPLSTFDNNPVHGNWILRVRDDFSGDIGQLVSWCLIIQHSVPQGVEHSELPAVFSLQQNYPNPFNASTRIKFTIASESDVRIVIYDMLGREISTIVNNKLKQGEYTANLNANDFASGVYFYTMYLDGRFFDTKKMIMIK